ncbi:putative phosphatase [Microbacteriaceae bacterium SG_E_30_P1]|uniref:Phosphatase n=1 Tax=Antiquaquibacter oligotrophicus TaxID=2880260 RepID=A0ABT6KLM1_9MICO|nr:histidine phosphatase family protein [Antiquaquibacter oligotrophicus]MDH6180898.1 putative phosphatase [Antiquaquibacter oligotrophicus]UDF13396.1 histidine phosphatase family protein [Antiquaquibacter oligotrophicus]
MLLYLVRHGETEWNREHRIQGSTDIPLNNTGRSQALATGELLAQRAWDAIYSSPLSRAMETGDIIATQIGLPGPVPVADLVERAYGEAEGLSDPELSQRFPAGSDVPGRESREAVVARVLPALLELAERHPDGAVLVVSHGGVIRSVLSVVDPDRHHGRIPNGSVHSFRHEGGSFSLIAFDDPIDEESLRAATDDLDQQNPIERREEDEAARA